MGLPVLFSISCGIFSRVSRVGSESSGKRDLLDPNERVVTSKFVERNLRFRCFYAYTISRLPYCRRCAVYAREIVTSM